MTIHLGPPLPTASSSQPGSTDGPSLTLPYLALLLVGFTWHPASPPDPVSSYLTLSPLPAFAEAQAGGLLSVALSLGSPPLDVIQHHALWSPDFPPPRRGAAIWSTSAKPLQLRQKSICGVALNLPSLRRSAATPRSEGSVRLASGAFYCAVFQALRAFNVQGFGFRVSK